MRTCKRYHSHGECCCMPLKDWAKKTGIPLSTLWRRINKQGWTIEKAFTERPKTPNKTYKFRGKTMTLAKWGKVTGLGRKLIFSRLWKGWEFKDAVTLPKGYRDSALIEFKGERLSLRDWAARIGVTQHALYMRIHGLKWPIEKALTTPPKAQEPLEPLEMGPATHFGQKFSPSAYDN